MTIEEIKARREKITPGPWESHLDGRQVNTIAQFNECRVKNWAGDRNRHICTLTDGEYCMYVHLHEQESNAQFIANAPTDIDWLIAEVERLTENMLEEGELG